MRDRTRRLHAQAERSGIIRRLLRGEADRRGYALLLRNLFPVYRELEAGLRRHRHAAGVRRVYQPGVFRANALAADLRAIAGHGWEETLPILAAGRAYVGRVAANAQSSGIGLIAHAYVRYLGDLNGGQVLRGLLSRQLGLGAAELAFLTFEQIGDPQGFKADYRQAMDEAGAELTDPWPVVEEAAIAFRLNIELSGAIEEAL